MYFYRKIASHDPWLISFVEQILFAIMWTLMYRFLSASYTIRFAIFKRALLSFLLFKTCLSNNQSGHMNDNGRAVLYLCIQSSNLSPLQVHPRLFRVTKGMFVFIPFLSFPSFEVSNEAPVTLFLYFMSMNYWKVRSLVTVNRNYEYGIFG